MFLCEWEIEHVSGTHYPLPLLTTHGCYDKLTLRVIRTWKIILGPDRGVVLTAVRCLMMGEWIWSLHEVRVPLLRRGPGRMSSGQNF